MPVLDGAARLGGRELRRRDGAFSAERRPDAPGQATRAMREADEALAALRARFEQTEDPTAQSRIADEALDVVERQLVAARDWRARLDSFEGSLWARRNRIERFLIRTHGRAWWRARRDRARGEGVAG
jgi:hypothetical protein